MSSTAIALTCVGSLIAIIGSLILLNLQSIKRCVTSVMERLDKYESRLVKNEQDLGEIKQKIITCKVDCEREFVDTGAFLRETGFSRRTLENLSASINRLEGQLAVTNKLPEIVGSISREIVKEMKKKE